ncbi:unnamed protein product [Mortierella alpina]
MPPVTTPSVPPSPAMPAKNPRSRSKAPPSASASAETSSSASSKSSAQKRKAMASTSTTPLPSAKVAKPTAGTSTVATSSGPSTRSRAAATTTTTTATTTADPSSAPPGRISPQSELPPKKKVFTTEETDWLIALLQTPRIYRTLQDYSVPRDWVYERIAEEFNSDFELTSAKVTSDQIGKKIHRIKTLFRRADARRVQMSFYGLPKEQWTNRRCFSVPFTSSYIRPG